VLATKCPFWSDFLSAYCPPLPLPLGGWLKHLHIRNMTGSFFRQTMILMSVLRDFCEDEFESLFLTWLRADDESLSMSIGKTKPASTSHAVSEEGTCALGIPTVPTHESNKWLFKFALAFLFSRKEKLPRLYSTYSEIAYLKKSMFCCGTIIIAKGENRIRRCEGIGIKPTLFPSSLPLHDTIREYKSIKA